MIDHRVDAPETRCHLCELPLPRSPISGEQTEGKFCCQGCLAVYQALGDGVIEAGERESQQTDVAASYEGESLFLAVDGMHCTTCESFLAARAASIDGITGIVASYATETARVYFDPDRISDEAIPEALSGYGYEAKLREAGDHHRETSDPVVAFLVGGGLFGMMVMIWYTLFLYPTYFGMDPIISPGGFDSLFIYANIWIFSSFVLFYSGWPILRGAAVSLLAKAPNMNLLVAIAALSAYLYSTLAMMLGRTDLYFDVSVAIILVVTAGTYYEGVIKRRAIGEIRHATASETTTVRRVDGTVIERTDIQPDDLLLIRPGERIPYDGVVTAGTATIDMSVLTGEALPIPVTNGEHVPGGAVVTDEPLEIEIAHPLNSTQDRLIDRLWTIQSGTPGIQRLADRLATIFVPVVLGLGVLISALSLLAGNPVSSVLLIGLTVLIVACPCALGLATPLAIASGVRNGISRGLLFVNATVFETAPTIRTIVFDKTGTLTDGEMTVQDIHGDDPEHILQIAADVERFSSHPIASAIVNHANKSIEWTPGSEVDETHVLESTTTENRGITGHVGEDIVTVGHPYLFDEISPEHEEVITQIRAAGFIPVGVGWDKTIHGIISVGDSIRASAREALGELSADHDVIVLTGDEGASADLFKSVSGVTAVFQGVPPEGKLETIRRLQRDGPVAMVGDGSNDAPSLAAADLGIAVANGTALATDAADVIIAEDNLESVATLFDHVDGTNTRMKQNLGWAFIYNGIAIPLALTGLLNPLLAAIAMATSSILVVSNSARDI